MLFVTRRIGVLESGRRETVIINERWELAIDDVYVEKTRPRLRLRALSLPEPYVFVVSLKELATNKVELKHLYMRYLDDVDDDANVIRLHHHGHVLVIGIARIRGNHVRIGFEGRPGVFRVRRNEKQD